MKVVKKIGKSILKAVNAQGFNIGVNTEKAAGQAVFHTHFHIIPRYENDGLHHWPGGKYTEGEMEKVRKSILSSLER